MTIDELKLTNWIDEDGHSWNPKESSEWIIYDFDKFIDKSGWFYNYFIPGWFINDLDTWIIQTKLKSYLVSKGRSIEQYAARFKYNYSDIPKCANPNCNNKVSLDSGKLSRGFRECCCLSCNSYYRWSLEGSKDRMHEALIKSWESNPDRKLELIERNKLGWSSMTAQERSDWSHYLSECKKRWWNSHPEAKIALSKSNSEAWKDPEYRRYMTGILIRGNAGSYQSMKSGLQSYRSGWELEFMQFLDQLDSVIEFKSEPFSIDYIWSDGSRHLYYPDFLVKTTTKFILVEIKPSYKLNDEINILKFKAGYLYSKLNNYHWLVLSELNWTDKTLTHYFGN